MRGIPSIVHSRSGAASVVAATNSGVLVDDWKDIANALEKLRRGTVLRDLSSRLGTMIERHSPNLVAGEYYKQLSQIVI
ncbi:UNVERIFIED_ORG: hypothetical protein ABIB19_003554 [Arthrobacter sp. UYEF10]